MSSKSKELIPKIVGASNKEEAIKVLHDVLQALYLTNNYTDIVKVKDEFGYQKEKYNRITDEYEDSGKDLASMIETRTKLNFLYRDISDRFSFDINRMKIYFEEYKTSVRAKSMENLKKNEEAQSIFNTTSTSSLRDIVGFDKSYQEYIANASISYGLWQELNNVLNSIRMFIDLLSSTIKSEHIVMQKDVK